MRTCVSPEADEMFERHRSILTGKFSRFVRVIPTDHYELDLSDNLQRHLCLTLIRISNDENVLAMRDDDYQDLSQHGDKSSFRNVKLDGQNYQLMAWFDEKYHLPYKGYLTFDFVSRTVPPSNAKACEDHGKINIRGCIGICLDISILASHKLHHFGAVKESDLESFRGQMIS